MRIPRDCYANLVAALSHDIRASVVRIFTCRELVANWSRRFYTCLKIGCYFFSQNISQDCRATVVRRSCECREPVAAKFWRIYNAMRNVCDTRTNVVRVSHDGRATVLRQHAKNSRLSGEKTNVVRHSHECRATVVRIKMKIRYIRGKVVRHSHECRATVGATVVRYIFKIRPKFANLSHKRLFNETATGKFCLYR